MQTIKQLFTSVQSALTAGTKATNVFREFIGFKPDNSDTYALQAKTMEPRYALILESAEYKKATTQVKGALRTLMSDCRTRAGYRKDQKGAISAKAPKADKKGPKAKGDTKPPKAEGMTDALAIARVAQLCAAFLTKDDAALASRLLAALDNRVKAAKVSKK